MLGEQLLSLVLEQVHQRGAGTPFRIGAAEPIQKTMSADWARALTLRHEQGAKCGACHNLAAPAPPWECPCIKLMPLPKLKDINWVTADCYGTLIDWEKGILDAFNKEADRDGFSFDEEPFLARFFEIQAEIIRGSYELSLIHI